MIYRLFIIITVLILSKECLSQDMKIGYGYLETGQYKKAIVYFDSVLDIYPANKTAKLCFGRATGLNGNAKKATGIFSELIEAFPKDFEVKLNYAESLLWNKNYKSASSYYQKLLKEDSLSFGANLGYASSLFQLKKFDTALVYINLALVSEPNNPNAKISKKYIQLELANEFIQIERNKEAMILLKNNLSLFQFDRETLFKIVDLNIREKHFNSAVSNSKIILEKTKDSLAGLNLLSLAYHLKGKNKKALKTSLLASQIAFAKQNKEDIKRATTRYIEALIWNQKYKKAARLIEELLVTNSEKNWLLLLRANLNMYKGEFDKSILDYNEILKTDSTSFNANFGKANALLSMEKYDEAHKAGLKTLDFHKNQKDVIKFLNMIDAKFLPSFENKTSYSADIGSNNAISNYSLLTFPLSTRFSLLGQVNYRNTNNSITDIKGASNNLMGGFTCKIKGFSHLSVKIGSASAKSSVQNYSDFSSEISLKARPFSLHMLELGTVRKFEDFNTDLIEKGILQNHFYLNYNINTHFNLGWFTQYYFTLQSDNNTRNLLFTSLYYSLLKKPLIKIGVNYQNIHFKNQVPNTYFSPDKFYAIEGFFDLIKDENGLGTNGLFYGLNAATGFQFIEDNKRQLTYRVNAKIGYKLNNNSLINLYGSHSNIASTTAAGFTITEVGARILIRFGKKPVFNYQSSF